MDFFGQIWASFKYFGRARFFSDLQSKLKDTILNSINCYLPILKSVAVSIANKVILKRVIQYFECLLVSHVHRTPLKPIKKVTEKYLAVLMLGLMSRCLQLIINVLHPAGKHVR